MVGVYLYLRDDRGWTPLGVAAWANNPRQADLVVDRAQGRAVAIPSGNLIHVVAIWWGIGGAAGVAWEPFLTYAQPIHQAMAGYDGDYQGSPFVWVGHGPDEVNLYEDAWEVDALTGQPSDPHNPNLPAPVQVY